MKFQPREKRRTEHDLPALDLILRRLAGQRSSELRRDWPESGLWIRLRRRDPLAPRPRRTGSFSTLERIRRFEERQKSH